MFKLSMRIFCAVFLISIGMYTKASVNYEPLAFYGVPLFYSNHTPRIAPCNFNKQSKLGSCGWTSYPENSIILVVHPSDPTKQLPVEYSMYQEVICENDQCYTSDYHEPYGYLLGFKGTTYWSVPTGYYLLNGPNGVHGVKFGNGPLKDTYPIRDVYMVNNDRVIDGEYLTLQNTRGFYNVVCSQLTQMCKYFGKEYTLLELNQIIPFVKTTTCDEFLCYINNDKGKVAGINPKRKDIYEGL
ncbi:hypothetical protein [Pseudomonas phage U1B]|nr:hypothetical protein [Pseudomonas phage T2P]QYV99390.1 hypothetical protein [Pseudomonas phage U1B]QYV99846.1 hypothetical protein [Pseudomonas phage U5]WAX23406.1 hypothetical protein [Pseudomonas phage pPA-N1803-4At.2]WNV49822.1 hypothetical protein [Pseudomonas phage ANB1]BBI55708.1 phage protein [Pseudomonas phage PA02]